MLGLKLYEFHSGFIEKLEKKFRIFFDNQKNWFPYPIREKDFYYGFNSGVDCAFEEIYKHLKENADLSESDLEVIKSILTDIDKHYYRKKYFGYAKVIGQLKVINGEKD